MRISTEPLLLIVVMLFVAFRPVSARIKFDWIESGATRDDKIAIEQCFRRVALVYRGDARYCPLGSIDFYASKDEYAVTFWDKTLEEREAVNMGGAGGDSALQLSQKIVHNIPALEVVLAHEMSHWYDVSMLSRRRRLPKDYMLGGELRAMNNESRYLQEVMKKYLPASVYREFRSSLDKAITAQNMR